MAHVFKNGKFVKVYCTKCKSDNVIEETIEQEKIDMDEAARESSDGTRKWIFSLINRPRRRYRCQDCGYTRAIEEPPYYPPRYAGRRLALGKWSDGSEVTFPAPKPKLYF